jgi:hypothetical protein
VHRIASLVGLQDIPVGDAAFDRMFVVQGADEAHVKSLFSSEALRALMVSEPEIEVSLQATDPLRSPAAPLDMDECVVEVPGRVEDGARLRRLCEIFAGILLGMDRATSGR